MTRRLLCALLLILTVSATSGAEPAPVIDLSGNWSGTWKSCETGHHGPLYASFCKIDDTCYQVRFRGRFFVVVPFRYTVVLHVSGQKDGAVLLSGSSDLPLVGTYRYTAVASGCEFHAEYCSRTDHGRFDLSR